MPLYKLGRKSRIHYDEVAGFVVRAKSEENARRLASRGSGCEGAEVWLDESRTNCERLQARGESYIILRDFRAG